MTLRLQSNNVTARTAGVSLIECLVYIVVFSILFGLGTGAFFFCWNHTRAVIYTTNDIESALRAGEGWRRDVRAATGVISVESTATNQIVTIPEGGQTVRYRLGGGELWRQAVPGAVFVLLLPKVKSSHMLSEPRGSVAAWRWNLQLVERRREIHMPLLFTFEAAAHNPP
jgi:hypothetical protein